ncbi:MAG TPA: hypothetical protein VF656_00515 [Pyrinomonadaceae bacterium]|jgi:ABC-type Zn2+ transport system substrate-binding protein/surface adhesin
MKFNFGGLKRTAASIFTTAALVVVFAGAGLEAFAQKPYKQHQKSERRELRREQRYERRTYGTNRTLRREHKAERRDLKAHQKAEKRYYRETRRSGYDTNNGRRAYRTKRPSWARARNR